MSFGSNSATYDRVATSEDDHLIDVDISNSMGKDKSSIHGRRPNFVKAVLATGGLILLLYFLLSSGPTPGVGPSSSDLTSAKIPIPGGAATLKTCRDEIAEGMQVLKAKKDGIDLHDRWIRLGERMKSKICDGEDDVSTCFIKFLAHIPEPPEDLFSDNATLRNFFFPADLKDASQIDDMTQYACSELLEELSGSLWVTPSIANWTLSRAPGGNKRPLRYVDLMYCVVAYADDPGTRAHWQGVDHRIGVRLAEVTRSQGLFRAIGMYEWVTVSIGMGYAWEKIHKVAERVRATVDADTQRLPVDAIIDAVNTFIDEEAGEIATVTSFINNGHGVGHGLALAMNSFLVDLGSDEATMPKILEAASSLFKATARLRPWKVSDHELGSANPSRQMMSWCAAAGLGHHIEEFIMAPYMGDEENNAHQIMLLGPDGKNPDWALFDKFWDSLAKQVKETNPMSALVVKITADAVRFMYHRGTHIRPGYEPRSILEINEACKFSATSSRFCSEAVERGLSDSFYSTIGAFPLVNRDTLWRFEESRAQSGYIFGAFSLYWWGKYLSFHSKNFEEFACCYPEVPADKSFEWHRGVCSELVEAPSFLVSEDCATREAHLMAVCESTAAAVYKLDLGEVLRLIEQ